MALTKLQIYNLALQEFLGARKVGATSENTQEALVLSDMYDPTLDVMLSLFPWKFSIRKSKVYPAAEIDINSITYSGTTATATTDTAHSFSDEYVVKIGGATPSGYNGKFPITNASGSTFDYTLSEEPDTNASGSDMAVRHTGLKFDYVFTLPSDCLRMDRLIGTNQRYDVDDSFIYADESDYLYIQYIESDTTESEQSGLFQWLFALKLAIAASAKLTGDRSFRKELLQEFDFWSKEFYRVDSSRANRDKTYDDDYSETNDYDWLKR